MVCDVGEMVSGVGLVCARRVGVGAVAAVSIAAVVASALSVLTALVPVDVAVPSSAVSAVAFLMAPSSALSVSLLGACCSAAA